MHSPEKQNVKYCIGYHCLVDNFASAGKNIQDKADLYKEPIYGQSPKLLNWNDQDPNYSLGYSFYGGEITGINHAVKEYLTQLPIDLLYMSPIFKARTNHKYDTVDYFSIDPQFGTMQDFETLVQNCHNNGIRLFLDGVFNHTSSDHQWYQRALKGENPYADYYQRNSEGYYITWDAVPTLPKLNYQNKDVQKAIFNDQNSAFRYWLDRGIDGWRLDVAEGLGTDVIQKLKNIMSKQYPNNLLIGEVVESYGRDWIGPKLLDGVMNYSFLGNTANFLRKKIDGDQYMAELNKMVEEYPWENLQLCWNIISTHDTNRMLFEVDGNENLFKIAVVLQFTYPGIPIIYYGDELGILSGKKDLNNRRGMHWQRLDLVTEHAREPKPMRAMDWAKVNQYSSFHYFYRFIIWLRKQNPVLTDGKFIPLYSNQNIIVYLRALNEKLALVAVNIGDTQEISIDNPEIRNSYPYQLKSVHGPISNIHLGNNPIKMTLHSQNAYIFLN